MFLETWGATPEEVSSAVVGDDLYPTARVSATRCITIAASPDEVYPWIRQMGFGRAGWYSYDLIDNLGKKSARSVNPDWQDIVTESPVPAGPISFIAKYVQPPTSLVLTVSPRGLGKRIKFSLAYELRTTNGGTRLVTRMRARVDLPAGRLIERLLLSPGDGVMVRKQLLTLRKVIESK